jgi:hypothetical protein
MSYEHWQWDCGRLNFKNDLHITKLAASDDSCFASDDSCFPGSDVVSLGEWFLACQSGILGLMVI